MQMSLIYMEKLKTEPFLVREINSDLLDLCEKCKYRGK